MRLLLTKTILLLLFFSPPVVAQEGGGLHATRKLGNRPPVSPDGKLVPWPVDSRLPGAHFLTSIPFRLLDGGIMLCKAGINSFTDSLNFIFDTGCGGMSLDSATASKMSLTPCTSDFFIHGIGGVAPQRLLEGLTLRLPDLNVDSLTVQVSDYDLLSSVYGEKIDGIIGYGFFSRYLVKIDYDSLKMFVYENGEVHYPKGGYLLRPRLSHLPMTEGRMNDARDIQSRFYFDTGAGLCLLFSSEFSSDSLVFGPKKKRPVRTEAAGLGGKAYMKLTTLRNFSLGPFRFRQIPTYIFDDSYDVTNYPMLGGLIGNDLLRRFNIVLNYERSEIYLLPNASFNQPFDYSYSGMVIGRIQGKIVVTGVMEDSPAEKAGFKEGDVVLAINGDTGQDMQAYQGFLRMIGPRVRVQIRRGDDTELLWLKVKSIL